MNGSGARRIWERRDPLGSLLWLVALPLSFLYGFGVRVRNLLYSIGWVSAKSLPCAVISVGNLTVGGTGKTPTTLWLARELENRGYRVAILTRGYMRRGKKPAILNPGFQKLFSAGEAERLNDTGDEPMMMAGIFGHKVGVGKKRREVGELLLRDAELDVFLLDDGFQHRQLKRDMDLLLLGGDWNGGMLPAGPFREPRSSIARANVYLVTGARDKWQSFLSDRPNETVYFGFLQPKSLLGLAGDRWKEYPLGLLDRSKILAVSAIANPNPFYRMIYDWEGEIVDTIEFPDHHFYSPRDWQRINRAARNVDLIVTTEKDILKLVRFPFAREKLLALRVEMMVENGNLLVEAVEKVIQSGKRN